MSVARTLLVLLVVCSLGLFAANTAVAQRGFGGGFGGNSALDLLQNASVQKELELLDDQIQQSAELAEQSRNNNTVREAFGQLRDLPEEERRTRIQEIIAKQREDQQAGIDKILLPHQSERLSQIEYQVSSRRGGGVGIGGRLADELEITEEQQTALREAAEKVMEELRVEQAKLQAQAQEKILSVLTAAQRAEYKKLVGEPFAYVPDPPQFGRGGDGGRGGDRGRQGGQGRQGRAGGRPGADNN